MTARGNCRLDPLDLVQILLDASGMDVSHILPDVLGNGKMVSCFIAGVFLSPKERCSGAGRYSHMEKLTAMLNGIILYASFVKPVRDRRHCLGVGLEQVESFLAREMLAEAGVMRIREFTDGSLKKSTVFWDKTDGEGGKVRCIGLGCRVPGGREGRQRNHEAGCTSSIRQHCVNCQVQILK